MKDPATTAAEHIAAHIEKHLGKIVNVFPDPAAEGARIHLQHVPASDERPIHTLVTNGMSARPMPMTADADAPRHIELMMTLPRQWQFDAEALRQEKWRWPLTQLQRLAHLPEQQGTALVWGQSVPNGDPPQPFAPDTQLCGVIIAPSLFVPPQFYELQTGGHSIAFYSAIPLYAEELAFRQEQGMQAMLSRLLDHGVQDVVDVRRRNVMRRKRFGLF